MRRGWSVLALLLVAGLLAAVQLLRVEQVRVTGISSLSARAVVRASGLQIGDRILWERLTAAERRIESLPAVAQATAERKLPATVVIRVRERKPLVRLDGARHLVVDASGSVFEAANSDVRAVLNGWKGRPRAGSTVDERSRAVLDAYSRFPPILRVWGRRITIGRSFVLTMLGGTQIRFGSLRDLETKAAVAEEILRRERGTSLAYIDVRSPAAPVSRERSAR